jgi:protein tyrosine/serine phosphatase
MELLKNMTNAKDLDKIAYTNFREVSAGRIAPKWLYRSSHPVIRDNHDFVIAELAETAKIAAVINLSDDDQILSEKAVLVPWYNDVFQNKRVIALNMDFDFFSNRFGNKLNKGIRFMFEHKGPYLIHCMQGIERTGFFVMLLEMLMGAGINEIINNHMASFIGSPYFEKGSVYHRREYGNIINILNKINGGESILREGDTIKTAENYISKNIGLTQSEIESLKLLLSKKQADSF